MELRELVERTDQLTLSSVCSEAHIADDLGEPRAT